MGALFLDDAEAAEPVHILVGGYLNTNADPMVPCVALVTPDHRRTIVRPPASRAYPNLEKLN